MCVPSVKVRCRNKQKNSRLQLTEWKSSCVRPARRRLCLSILRFRWTAISSCQCRQSMNFEEKDFRI